MSSHWSFGFVMLALTMVTVAALTQQEEDDEILAESATFHELDYDKLEAAAVRYANHKGGDSPRVCDEELEAKGVDCYNR